MAEQENGSAAAAGMVGVKAQVVVAGAKGEEAVRFYKAAFGAEEVRRATHPKRKAEHELPLLIFAELRIGASSFLVSDRIDDDSVPAAGEGGFRSGDRDAIGGGGSGGGRGEGGGGGGGAPGGDRRGRGEAPGLVRRRVDRRRLRPKNPSVPPPPPPPPQRRYHHYSSLHEY
uniref:Glyoxalase At5g48480-like N-terminal domain-containing protein n=1 Tax=Ananas comosus var. bracteatus TaxID=296719 RepID=A0A6V7P150_ANACO|nr:unnamed protein product [Ananas comosus var. bracteatus]